MALYIISMHLIHTNSRSSTHWKLNLQSGKVQTAVAVAASREDVTAGHPDDLADDHLFSILTSRVSMENGEWKLESGNVGSCTSECRQAKKNVNKVRDKVNSDENSSKKTSSKAERNKTSTRSTKKKKKVLDCGKPVNVTEYDHLRGIALRHTHPQIPEPEVAMIFKKKGSRNTEVDMNELEKRLKKEQRLPSAHIFNQIGNFWRIKGDTQISIDCFRKALSISPSNPDVLLNLARVLFNLQYLDDAIFLTRRSLEMQAPDENSWLQHFTLGEILKAYGHYHEASLHFRHTLDLNPGFQPAQAHLREMEMRPDGTVTYYTLFIILFLVLGVLCGILTSIDGGFEELGETMKTQRHFNRAMAMRSIKLGINPKLIRTRKQNAL
ncbi:hypothetical protein LSAT2_010786 [Lamellibrachia satsuma]|nr:hypothetical protein LSAT2_010786 [Lamellibrachia satsuma]